MKQQRKILVCTMPVDPAWQLGKMATGPGTLLLVGWELRSASCNCGVPVDVAGILVQGLMAGGTLTFAVSADTQDDLIPQVRLQPRGLLERASSTLSGRPRIKLLTAATEQQGVRIFDEPSFPWVLQGQAGILLPPGHAPIDISHHEYFALFADNWQQSAMQLHARGVMAVVRPGVDGDVLALASASPAIERDFLAALERSAASAGFGVSLLSEAAFKDALSARG